LTKRLIEISKIGGKHTGNVTRQNIL